MAKYKVYIILGSNIEDKKKYIDSACDAISTSVGSISLNSSFYQTSPWGFESEDEFLNKAICVETSILPIDVIKKLLQIETTLGRVRDVNSQSYQSRTIDIDILLIDDLILDEDILTVPHPRMQERNFVLIPLAEIAGEVIHPKENKSINDLLSICKDDEVVTKVF